MNPDSFHRCCKKILWEKEAQEEKESLQVEARPGFLISKQNELKDQKPNEIPNQDFTDGSISYRLTCNL